MSTAQPGLISADADISCVLEPHYTVEQIAERLNLSASAVRKLFQDEPGVLAIGEARPRFGRRRGRVTLRIPQSVLERVYRRQCVSG